MPIPRTLRTTAHGLFDIEFKHHALPSILPGIYLAGIVPAVLIPLILCTLAFRHSTFAGLIAILCSPLVIVAGVVVVRFLLELLLSIGAFSQILARIVNLIFGFHDTMADVTKPASAMASGIRAVQRPKKAVKGRRVRR